VAEGEWASLDRASIEVWPEGSAGRPEMVGRGSPQAKQRKPPQKQPPVARRDFSWQASISGME